MKKMLLASLFAVGMISTNAFAYTQPLYQYSSTLHPQSASSGASLLHPPTDITVINASSSSIYAVVPNSPVNDYLTPGYNDHIYNYDPNLFYTYLVLQDAYRATFFAGNVCRLAIVTVYGYTGNFSWNIDSDLCN